MYNQVIRKDQKDIFTVRGLAVPYFWIIEQEPPPFWELFCEVM